MKLDTSLSVFRERVVGFIFLSFIIYMGNDGIINNPWVSVNSTPYIASCDIEVKKDLEKEGCDLRHFPEPFIGNPDAKIYILLANPGLGDDKEIEFHERNKDILKKNLLHKNNNSKFPFYYLDPIFNKSDGGAWWNRVFDDLISKGIKREKIAQDFFGIELYGYHSEWSNWKLDELNSSKYMHHLIGEAIRMNKMIIMPRARNRWFSQVPELKDYENCHFMAINRSIEISETTISPAAYKEILNILR